MSKIKLKNEKNKIIKKLNKAIKVSKNLNSNFDDVKRETNDIVSPNDSVYENESNKIINTINKNVDIGIASINKYGRENFKKTNVNIFKIKDDFKINQKKSRYVKSVNKIKNTKKIINKKEHNKINISKSLIKTKDNSKKIFQISKFSIEKTIKVTKNVVKISVKSLKAIVAGIKTFISALIAGGWIVLVIIIVICMIGLLCNSIFGIFFSSEKEVGKQTMNNVVSNLNYDMANKISEIQKENVYDDYIIETNKTDWKDILAIYVAKISNGNDEINVITLDDNKISILSQIYWDTNQIRYEIKNVEIQDEMTNIIDNKKILYIYIDGKSKEELMEEYNFNVFQKEQVSNLLDSKYDSMWTSVIYGPSLGNKNIVEIALSQIGNVGGEPYWSWYGFSSRVEWCACFISWVANQAGLIDKNIIPKFSSVQNGIDWFKAVGEWRNANYVPRPGDIIFFDWENDGKANHVGIVEKIENNKIYTIEGNSKDDMSRENKYRILDKVIYGYGVPNY